MPTASTPQHEVNTATPERVLESIVTGINSGDLESLMPLYESEAAFATQPGSLAHGPAGVREALTGFISMQGELDLEVTRVLEVGDLALVVGVWSFDGTGPDGEPVRLEARNADVLRRQTDGTWRFVIDNPWEPTEVSTAAPAPSKKRRPNMLTTSPPMIIGPTDGESVTLQTIGVRFVLPGADSDTRFSLVEHPMPPRALAAPLHRHNREDEYSFVLEGRMGALLGDDVVEASPGDLVYKPRGQWHTFWNAGDEPARILEIISPAGFERFFAELAPLSSGGAPDPQAFGELCDRYALDMQPESLPELVSRFGVWFPGVE